MRPAVKRTRADGERRSRRETAGNLRQATLRLEGRGEDMTMNDGGPAFCSRCEEPATIKQGNQKLCDRHYRFGQMRANAKRHGKAVPEYALLETIAVEPLSCGDCKESMVWRSRDSKSRVASLQHYRDGTFGLVCRSCNTRHAYMEGDSFRDMPKDHKLCPCCQSIRPFSEFSRDNGRTGPMKLKSWCKPCSSTSHKEWRASHGN